MGMRRTFRNIDVEDLLKVVLLLVVVWLVLEIVGFFVRLTLSAFHFLQPVIGIALVVLIALWLLDRL